LVLAFAFATGSAFAQSALSDFASPEVSGTPTVEPSLAPVVLLDQPPNQVNGLFADASQFIGDQFVVPVSFGALGITEMVLWGGYFPENCPNPTDVIDLIITNDAGGVPGAVVDSRSGVEADARVDTGVDLFGVDEWMFTFDYSASPVILTPGTYWVEFRNAPSCSTNFFWETGDLDGTNGILNGIFSQDSGATWNPTAFDQAILINGDDAIPVELISFDVVVIGTDVSLNWATASETNNAGFEVQLQEGENWNALGWIEGHGTTTEAQTYSYTADDLGVGTHTFRLKQIDFDGVFAYHGNVEVTVETPGTHEISSAYPNPFNPQSQFTLAVAQDQVVTAELYNTLGQRVAVLFSGTVEANQAQLVTIDGAGLASGMYIVRVNGERFSDALSVTLLK